MKLFLAFSSVVLLATAPSLAVPVAVSATGQVIFNGITTPPLSGVTSGQTAHMSFMVDSNNFVDGIPGDTRGYEIDAASFALSFGSAADGDVTVGLLDPFPSGQTPFFTLVDGFPVSDGFFVSTSPVSPGGVPLSQSPINFNLDLGYVGSTLGSLNILDAQGTYDFTGLTRFSMTLWRVVPDNTVLEMDFASLTISAIPEPSAGLLLVPVALWGLRRRR